MGANQSCYGACVTPPKKCCRADNLGCSAERKDTHAGHAVALTEGDLTGEGLKNLLVRKDGIDNVSFVVDRQHSWIPTDDDLARLKALPRLTCLDLTGCQQITRRGLENVSLSPSRIRVLLLNHCVRITDKFFDLIVHFSHLERLEVRGCFRISDRGVEAISVLRRLRHLDLSTHVTQCETCAAEESGCGHITNASLLTVGRMTRLETLRLECCTLISNEGLIRLVTLHHLKSLNLYATGLSDGGLNVLSKFSTLRALNIGSCFFTDSQTLQQQLIKATKLEELALVNASGGAVTDALVQELAKYLDLKSLDICGCDHLSDVCLTHISSFSSLTCLCANACPGIHGHSIIHLSTLQHLSALHLSDGLEVQYADFLRFKALECLEIAARSAEDEELLSSMRAMKHLRELILHLPDDGNKPQSRATTTLAKPTTTVVRIKVDHLRSRVE